MEKHLNSSWNFVVGEAKLHCNFKPLKTGFVKGNADRLLTIMSLTETI